MKQALMNKINPIIEHFIDDIIKSFDGLEKTRQDLNQSQEHYRELIVRKDRELDDIKRQKVEDKEAHDRKITEMEEARKEYVKKTENYKNLIDEQNIQKKETEENLSKSKIELARAKDVRVQAEKVKEEAENLKRNYELKLDSLKIDFNKLDEGKKEAIAEKIKLSARENEIYINEKKQNQRANDLNDQELKIKAERKETERLIKRYNLEQKLKEG